MGEETCFDGLKHVFHLNDCRAISRFVDRQLPLETRRSQQLLAMFLLLSAIRPASVLSSFVGVARVNSPCALQNNAVVNRCA